MQRPTLDLRAHCPGGNTVAIVQRRKRTRIEKRVRQRYLPERRRNAIAQQHGCHRFAQHGLARPEKPYALSFDRSYMSLEAASHGLGFALESTLLAQKYLANGSLVEVAPEALSAAVTAHHLVFPKAHSSFPRVGGSWVGWRWS